MNIVNYAAVRVALIAYILIKGIISAVWSISRVVSRGEFVRASTSSKYCKVREVSSDFAHIEDDYKILISDYETEDRKTYDRPLAIRIQDPDKDVREASGTRDVLPEKVVPTHYKIEITPGIEDGKGNHIFYGLVDINIYVKESTDIIHTNAKELVIESIGLVPIAIGYATIEVKEWSLSAKEDRLKIVLPNAVEAGSKWVLRIKYSGIHNDNMAGFYRVAVYHTGKKEYMFSTQFESRDCCRAVPCWDEPAIKCTFDVKLKVPKDMVALSNTDIISDTIMVSEEHQVTRIIEYATTPRMSTYLLAFIIGKLAYVEGYTELRSLPGGEIAKKVRCRVYATPNHVDKCDFALKTTIKVLEYYENYFDTPYPLNKLDQVAVADFSAGAMENWGLITYRENALIYDLSKSSSRNKIRIVETISHELAHQWFGNLVTMEWWNDLWLNEGFATFAAVYAVDNIFPEWKVLTNFITENLSSALSMDSLASTHPVSVPVNNISEINQIFDKISYSKGASIINMVYEYLEPSNFREGLRDYIKSHKYGNTKSEDIWKALDTYSNSNLSFNMKTWVEQPGYPLVTVEEASYDEIGKRVTLTLSQERFYAAGSPPLHSSNETIWWIPLSIIIRKNRKYRRISYQFNTKRTLITFPLEDDIQSYWKINSKSMGVYRVLLPEKEMERICAVLKNDISAMGTDDKVGFLLDSYAVARSGKGNFKSVLDLISALKSDTSLFVISSMAMILNSLTNNLYMASKSTIDALKKFTRAIFSDSMKSLGYDYPSNESTLNSLKRSVLLNVLSNADDEDVIKELKRRFKKYLKGDHKALHSDAREITFRTVLRRSSDPEKDLKDIIDIYKAADTPDQSLQALSALGAVNSSDLVRDLIHKYFFDKDFIRPQDIMYLVNSVSSKNSDTKYANTILWNFISGNWGKIYELYSSSPSILGSVFTVVMDNQVGYDVITTVTEWINGKDLQDRSEFKKLYAKRREELNTINRDIEQSLEDIEIRTRWVQRGVSYIEKWLQEKKYLLVYD